MATWSRFETLELESVPRLPSGPGEDEAEHRRNRLRELTAGLGGAHAALLAQGAEAQVVSAWMRGAEDPRVHVLVGGCPRVPFASAPVRQADRSDLHSLLFPPGAVARTLDSGALTAMLGSFRSWVGCDGRADALWAPSDTSRNRPTVRRGSFDLQVAHLAAPFAWLVLAEPLAGDVVQAELERLAAEILPLSRGEVGETKRVELERRQARHRELSRVKDLGAWRIRVAVGAAEAGEATMLAGMLCAAAELDELPYALVPATPPLTLPEVLAGTGFVGSSDVLAALARPPERELPGLTLVEAHTFDQTSELARESEVDVGTIVNESGEPVGQLTVSKDILNRHTFVCGATGSGKSQSVRHLLTEATRSGLPWLVIEPAKAEYALMAPRLAGLDEQVLVIRPGAHDALPAGFNPLQPVDGFPLQTHVDLVRALFLAAFEAQEPFPQILATALTRSYEELGWDLTLGTAVYGEGRPRYPTLADLERVADSVVDEIGYGREVTDNVRGFIKVRIGSLRLGTAGRFFEGGHTLDLAALRRRNVVLEIEDVGDDADKAFFIGAVLLQQTEYLRVLAKAAKGRSMPLSHLTVIEEAHRLLRRPAEGASGPAHHAVEAFASMLAEVRAYGEGLIVVEQIPSKLTPDVIKNTALKIVHRLPAADDRESVGATMNIDERQSRQLVSLHRGKAAVFADGMDRAVLVQMKDGTDVEKKDVPALGVDSSLVERRSTTCGADCRNRACAGAEISQAQQLLRRTPWLTLWAELVVVAHLAGHRTPRLDAALFTQLRPVDRRVVDCALAHAVDGAVSSRSGSLQPRLPGDELARHCVEALTRTLTDDGAGDPCKADDYAYLSRLDQWTGMRSFIMERPPDGPRDPRTDEWQLSTGRLISGQTPREQLKAVIGYAELAQSDRRSRDEVTFGARRPSALERAIGSTPADTSWASHVDHAVTVFPNVGWIQDYLALSTTPQLGGSDG